MTTKQTASIFGVTEGNGQQYFMDMIVPQRQSQATSPLIKIPRRQRQS